MSHSFLMRAGALVLCGLPGCYSTPVDHQGTSDSYTEERADTPVGTEVPGLAGAVGHYDFVEEVAVAEWVQAADAIVLGTVSELLPASPPAVAIEDDPQVAVLVPFDGCLQSEVGHFDAFSIRLTDVEVFSGTAPETMDIRFGLTAVASFDDVRPMTVDGHVVWPKGIEVGTRIGGAVYRIPGHDSYGLGTGFGQPFLYEDAAGHVWFQPTLVAGSRYRPPVSELEGLRTEDFVRRMAALSVDRSSEARSGNAYREMIRGGPPSHPSVAIRWHDFCWPPDYAAEEPDFCFTDSDCEPGEVCVHEVTGSVCEPDP